MKHLRSNPYNLNVSVITSSFMIDKNSLYFSCVSQNYREHFLFPTDFHPSDKRRMMCPTVVYHPKTSQDTGKKTE